MNTKHLLTMAGVLAAMIIIGFVAKSSKVPVTIEKQAGLVRIAPEGFSVGSLSTIEFFNGKDKSVLKLIRSGEGWQVVNAWNASADALKLAGFIDRIANMRGLKVSEKPENFVDRKVDEKDGMFIRCTKTGEDKPYFALVVGKARGRDSCFVRLEGDNSVYEAGLNIRDVMGVYGEGSVPSRTTFLKTDVLTVSRPDVIRLELRYPDHSLVFAREQKGVEDQAAASVEKPKADGEVVKAQPVEYGDWTLVSGGYNKKFRINGLNRLLNGLKTITAGDVVDPARKAELGLDQPQLRMVAKLKDGSTVSIDASGKMENGKYLYAIINGDDKNIYEMESWMLSQIFVGGDELFDIKPKISGVDKCTGVEVVRDGLKIALSRKSASESLVMTEPKAGFALKKTVTKDVLKELGALRAVDYAESDGLVKYGLQMPAVTVSVTLADGKKSVLKIGKAHPVRNGSYACIDDGEVFVLSSSQIDKIAFILADSLEPGAVLNAKADEARSFEVALSGGDAVLFVGVKGRDGKQQWKLSRDKKLVAANSDAVTDTVSALCGLKAVDFCSFVDAQENFADGKVSRVTLGVGNKSSVLEFGAEFEKRIPVRITGRPVVMLVEKEAAQKILRDKSAFAAKPLLKQ